MRTTSLWSIKSRLYGMLRRIPPATVILRAENESVRSLAARIPAGSVRSALDLGSGRGNALSFVPAAAHVVLAVDISPAMLGLARKDHPRAAFVAGDASAVPVRAGAIDLVLCVGLSEYVADLEALLVEISRVLAPRGHAVLTSAPRHFLSHVRSFLGHRVHSRDSAVVRAAIAQAGFEITGSGQTGLQTQWLLRRGESY